MQRDKKKAVCDSPFLYYQINSVNYCKMQGVEEIEKPFELFRSALAVIEGYEGQGEEREPDVGKGKGADEAIDESAQRKGEKMPFFILKNKRRKGQKHAHQAVIDCYGNAKYPRKSRTAED